jgi:hypothetical protein
MKIQQSATKAILTSKRSVALLLLVTSLIVFSFDSSGLGAQQAAFTISGKVSGGPTALRARQGGDPLVSLEGNVAPQPAPRGMIIEEELRRVSLRARMASDGSFTFSNVPAGRYQLTTTVQGAEQQSIPTVVVADRDVTGVTISLVRNDVVTTQRNLDLAWSLPGPWSGVATWPESGTLYAGIPGDPVTPPLFARVAASARIREIDFNGKTLRDIATGGFASTKIEFAHLSGSSDPDFLLFESFIDGVHALDSNGSLLWTHAASGGAVYDVAAIRGAGSASDDVAVSFSGKAGVHILNGHGAALWKSESETFNRRAVAAGDVRGDGTTQLVTTSDAGHLQIFSRSGTMLGDLGARIPASFILLSKLSPNDGAATILAIGTQTPGPTVAVNAVSSDGKTRWSAALQSNINPAVVYSAAILPGKPWLAVSLEGGQVFVLDAAQGTLIASIDGQTRLPEVAWVTTANKSDSRLIVSTHDMMRAYNLTAP